MWVRLPNAPFSYFWFPSPFSLSSPFIVEDVFGKVNSTLILGPPCVLFVRLSEFWKDFLPNTFSFQKLFSLRLHFYLISVRRKLAFTALKKRQTHSDSFMLSCAIHQANHSFHLSLFLSRRDCVHVKMLVRHVITIIMVLKSCTYVSFRTTELNSNRPSKVLRFSFNFIELSLFVFSRVCAR